MLFGLGLRTWNVNFDGGLNVHPDERNIACFYAPTIGWPSSVDEFLDPRRSPLNPLWDRENDRRRSFTYGHFPLYLGILSGELLSELAAAGGWLPLPPKILALMEQANSPCAGVAVAGRLLMALLDTATIGLLFLLGRRLYGAAVGLLAAAFYACAAQAVQLSHFFAMDPASATFVVLAVYGGVLMAQDRFWRGVVWSGMGSGLAIAAKFSAAPILAVPVAAALIVWRTGAHGWRLVAGALLALLLACAFFILTSPYAALDWENFMQATLVEQGRMVRGLADLPYTRQYRNTTPYLYFMRQQVVWGLGWPLGLLALAGSGWALAKAALLRARPGELVVWTWLIPYFGVTGAFLAKFNRYMSPVLPFALLFAAGLVGWLSAGERSGERGETRRARLWSFPGFGLRASRVARLARGSKIIPVLLIGAALGGGLFWSLAYVHGVYGHEHTWVAASRWVYANAPAGSVILWELWDDPLPKRIPGEAGLDMGSHGLRHIDWSPYEEDTGEKYAILKRKLREADYVIYSSKRIYESVDELPERYPLTIRYYELMFGEQLGFVQAAEFTSPPRLLGWVFADQEADESWSLYDHPRVSIFAKQRELSDAEFDALLEGSWKDAFFGYRGKDSLLNWATLVVAPTISTFFQRATTTQSQPLDAQSVISAWRPNRSEAVSRCDTFPDDGERITVCSCRSRPPAEEWRSLHKRLTAGQPITLGDAAKVTLLGWELLRGSTPQPTETVVVRLYWQPHGRINEELHSFLHLYAPSLQRAWVATQNHYPSCQPTKRWHPGNYYVDELRLTIPSDTPPVPYSLVVGLVSSDGARLAVPGSTNDLVHLRPLEVAPTRTGFFQRALFLRERPTIRTRADTADGLRLQGYDLQTANSHESQAHGGSILRLFWETTAQGPATDWITYVHLHDPQGERIAQFDGPALAGLQPTSHWQTDALYIDQRQISLPTDLPPGTYLFRIGLYNFSSGERLPFRPDPDDQAHFENSQLLVPLKLQ